MARITPSHGLACALLSTVLLGAATTEAADPIKLNSPLDATGDVFDFTFSPDSSRVLYRADASNNVFELFSVPSDGSAMAVTLNGTLVTGGNVASTDFSFSPDSQRVLYRADELRDGVDELFTVPADGSSQSVRVSNPMASNRDVIGGAVFSPDSMWVAYQSDQLVDERFEIYSVPADGSGAALRVSGEVAAEDGEIDGEGFIVPIGPNVVGDVGDFAFTPDSSAITFIGDLEVDSLFDAFTFDTGVFELFRVPVDGSMAPATVSGQFGGMTMEIGIIIDEMGNEVPTDVFTILGDVIDYKLSPDGMTAVFRAQDDINDFGGQESIWTVSAAGGGTAVQLNTPLPQGGEIFPDYQFSPDSTRILYRGDQFEDGIFEIYTVASDGSSGPVPLNGPLVLPGGDVISAEFSPDSSKVIFRADQFVDERFELFTVPSDGTSAPTPLNGELVEGGDVSSNYQISADSSRVLYHADQDTNQVFELYTVKSDGSEDPIKVSGDLVAGGDVSLTGFQFSPDSSRVIYVADQDTDFVNELYIVPSDGGKAVKVNGELVAGGDVSSQNLQFSPDGSRLLYRADQDTDGIEELFVRILRNESTGGGNWDSGSTWEEGVAPDAVQVVTIQTPGTITASNQGGVVERSANQLTIQGGAVVEFVSGATLDVANDLTVSNTSEFQTEGGVTVGRNLDLQAGSLLDANITTPGMTEPLIDVDGTAVLNGELDFAFINFFPTLGDEYIIVAADGGVTGEFTAIDAPNLGTTLKLVATYTENAMSLIVARDLQGDFNSDGIVDALDYALWRDSLGEMGDLLPADGNRDGVVNSMDYDLWKAGFGGTFPGSIGNLSVPEPGSMALLLVALTAGMLRTRRRA